CSAGIAGTVEGMAEAEGEDGSAETAGRAASTGETVSVKGVVATGLALLVFPQPIKENKSKRERNRVSHFIHKHLRFSK
ncbi:MAG: hypothetical protein IIY90_09915, partial [Oscillospiraceae bacterium]|nr:hypothetical protein [Oscillospiraceae bacterium]